MLFLDRRDDPEGLEISFYLATSTDGGATFGPNVMISDGVGVDGVGDELRAASTERIIASVAWACFTS